MRSRRSQAALEFIMTYGWAILVVLVAIGALAYFGVLSPDRFLPSKCVLQSGLGCLDHRATASQVQVVVQNSLGFDIDTIVVGVGECGDYPGTVGSTGQAALSNGQQATFSIPCTLSGSRLNEDFNVSYNVPDTGLSHNNVGEITARLE